MGELVFVDQAISVPWVWGVQPGRRAGGAALEIFNRRGRRSKALWPGIALFVKQDSHLSFQDAQDRLLYRQAIRSLRFLHHGVLRTQVEGIVGSVLKFILAPRECGVAFRLRNRLGDIPPARRQFGKRIWRAVSCRRRRISSLERTL